MIKIFNFKPALARRLSIILPIMLYMFASSCSNEANPSASAVKASEIPTIDISSPVPSKSILPTITTATNSNNNSIISPSDLDPGQYIVYCGADDLKTELGDVDSLFIMDLGGKNHGRLAYNVCYSSYSSDMNRIVYEKLTPDITTELMMLDLLSGEDSKIEGSRDCSQASWAPNKQDFVAICENNVYLFSFEDIPKYLLIDCEGLNGTCGSPNWSPNGKYIIYDFTRLFDTGSGVFAIDAECVYNQQQCEPFRVGNTLNLGLFAWSPDSNYVAAPLNPGIIGIINFSTGSIVEFEFLPEASIRSMSWSPDGKFLAVASFSPTDPSKQIYLIDVDNGEYREVGDNLEQKTVMFWLNIQP